MKTLFVCSGNVGRSQMAEAYYNHFTQSNDGYSAGTSSDTPAKYPQLPNEICQIMAEEGLDVTEQRVKTIDKRLVSDADQIFIMCGKDKCPDFLSNADNLIYWEIEDPYKMSINDMIKVRDQIKRKVLSIVP